VPALSVQSTTMLGKSRIGATMLIVALLVAVALGGCSAGTPFRSPGYDRERGVTAPGASETVVVAQTQGTSPAGLGRAGRALAPPRRDNAEPRPRRGHRRPEPAAGQGALAQVREKPESDRGQGDLRGPERECRLEDRLDVGGARLAASLPRPAGFGGRPATHVPSPSEAGAWGGPAWRPRG
jgi:hypothetical protein